MVRFAVSHTASVQDTDSADNEWPICTIALCNLQVLPGVNTKFRIARDEITLGAAVDLIGAKAILVPSSSALEPVWETVVRARFELFLIMMRKRDRVIGFCQSGYPDHGSVAGQVVSSYSQPHHTTPRRAEPSCSVAFKTLVLNAHPVYSQRSIGCLSSRSNFECLKRYK